jgi:hypothetical protein
MSNHRKTTFLAVLGLLTASAASAAPASCLSPEQQSAFDVGALKSELSVLAVGCSNENEYNRFVEMHRRELLSQDATVNAWFKRTYGKVAQPRYDSYITLLANEQSEIGQKQGSDFCPRLAALFPEVMAVPSASLAQYAAAKDLMPADLTPCAAVGKASTTSRSTRASTSTHHKK